MTTRRRLLIALAAGVFVGPFATLAQQKPAKVLRIGRLSPVPRALDAPQLEALRRGLRDLGWVEGETFSVENRIAEGRQDRLPGLAAELVRLKVDVIVTGSSPAALAAKNATSTIPIVMVANVDPVASGFVASLSRPGGNLTGVTTLGQELSGKRLQLLKEAAPGVTRIAALVDVDFFETSASLKGIEDAALSLGIQLRVVKVGDPAGFEQAFAAIRSGRAEALIVGTGVMFNTHRRAIVERVAKSRLPAVYGLREFVDAGGLMFYGTSLPDAHRQAATLVDKILKGAKPSDLPFEQPSKFELVINLRTARALKLEIPGELLLRADKVIE